jgi:membrane protein DedA with SNARE-associated domain
VILIHFLFGSVTIPDYLGGPFASNFACEGATGCREGNCDYRYIEVILLSELEVYVSVAQGFILERPVLLVLVGGLVVAILSVIGESVTYWVARLGGRPLIERMARRFHMDIRHMDRTERLFMRWGLRLVLFGRVLPGVRTLVSVPAGITRMDFGLFFGASFSGAYIWNTLLMAASYFLGFNLTLFGLAAL